MAFTDIIEVTDLEAMLGDPDVRIIDCRFDLGNPAAGLDAWQAGHIPGAVFADLDKDLSGSLGPTTGRHPLPRPEALERSLARLGVSAEHQVIVYDDASGAFAARAWWLIRWLGHDAVALLNGGYAAWCGAGMPVTAEPRQWPRGNFEARATSDRVLTTQALAVGEGLPLVDVREAERFEGAFEPIDSVAGHVPGACNLPLSTLRDADGRLLPAEELAGIIRAHLGEKGGSWSVMCGSGVTACLLVVAALVARLPEPRLYAGSFSEWISDSSRPVAVGPARSASRAP